MKIALITDTWHPQINGVVRTLDHVIEELKGMGHLVDVISPADFISLPCPTYPEIRLALATSRKLKKRLGRAEAIHIANEGPLGYAARKVCLKKHLPFTSSYHTKLAEYTNARFPFISKETGYGILRRFHAPSRAVLAPTKSIKNDLKSRGFRNVKLWSRGVDTNLFRPKKVDLKLKKPIYLSVGRVSIEKNLEAFLDLELKGTKLVVGDGPHMDYLQTKYSDVVFVGCKEGEELVDYYSGSDVFVFPSETDTFGLVQLEALACGIPVAAHPVPGPKDVLIKKVGAMNRDLRKAIKDALKLSKKDCCEYAQKFSWKKCAKKFEKVLVKIDQ